MLGEITTRLVCHLYHTCDIYHTSVSFIPHHIVLPFGNTSRYLLVTVTFITHHDATSVSFIPHLLSFGVGFSMARGLLDTKSYSNRRTPTKEGLITRPGETIT